MKKFFALAMMFLPAFGFAAETSLERNDPCYDVTIALAKALKISFGHKGSKFAITTQGADESRYYTVLLTATPYSTGNGRTYEPEAQYEIELSNDSASKCMVNFVK